LAVKTADAAESFADDYDRIMPASFVSRVACMQMAVSLKVKKAAFRLPCCGGFLRIGAA